MTSFGKWAPLKLIIGFSIAKIGNYRADWQNLRRNRLKLKPFFVNAFMTFVIQNPTTQTSMVSSYWLSPVTPRSRLNYRRAIPCWKVYLVIPSTVILTLHQTLSIWKIMAAFMKRYSSLPIAVLPWSWLCLKRRALTAKFWSFVLSFLPKLCQPSIQPQKLLHASIG